MTPRAAAATLFAGFVVPVLGVVLLAAAQEGSSPPPFTGAVAAAPASGLYVGPASCAQELCHGAQRPSQVYDVLQNEYYTWLDSDPHARAWDTLLEPRSVAMAKSFGLAEPPTRAAACLACHAPPVPAARRAGPLDPSEGVTCERCHGPASGWRSEHTAADWTHADSVAAGMTDLADLGVRARTCLDCHLGGPGRVVDHDLIAAGHPRLQFELDNYSRAMPPHWLPDPAGGARAWAVGQVEGFRAGLAELARRARSERWPDFSQLSCGACHHELNATGAAAAATGSGGSGTTSTASPFQARIGLPPWSPARWALLRLAVERAAPDALPALDRDVAALGRRVSRLSTPPAKIAGAAESLEADFAGVAGRLRAARWTPRDARDLLGALAAEGTRLAATDMATAEQAVHGVYALGGYLLAVEPGLLSGELVAALTTLGRRLEDPVTVDAAGLARDLARVAAAAGTPNAIR